MAFVSSLISFAAPICSLFFTPGTIGGNDELRPSTARSYTAGVVFTPVSAMNWKISADYWRIDVRNRVLALPPQLLLANEAQFRDRIVRDP